MMNTIRVESLLSLLGYTKDETAKVDLWEDQTSLEYINNWCRFRHEYEFGDIDTTVNIFTDLGGFVLFIQVEGRSPSESKRDVIIKVSPAFTIAEYEDSFIERGLDVYKNCYGDIEDIRAVIFLRNIFRYGSVKKDYSPGDVVHLVAPGDIWFGRSVQIAFPEENGKEYGVINPANYAGRIYAYWEFVSVEDEIFASLENKMIEAFKA
jgi:hypothetical protein